MKIDLNKYAINKKPVQKWYKEHAEEGVNKSIGILGSSVHCPFICLAFYLAEDIGFTEELIQTIDSLIKFYGYTDIQGQKEGSPYMHLDSTKKHLTDNE